MYDSNHRGTSYTAGFFILIAFTVAALMLVALFSILIWQQMTGLGFAEMEKNTSNPAYTNVMQVLQAINAVIGFLLPAVVVATILNRKPMKLLGFPGKIEFPQIGLVIAITVLGLFVSSSLAYLNEIIPIPHSWEITFQKWENNYNEQIKAIIQLQDFKDYVIALGLMAFLPALCEEALFRGGFQNFLTRSTRMPWLSIIIVSIIFSAVHISFYGFLSRFFLGMMLGIIYQYSGRIWLNILAHFINNAVALTAVYIFIQQGKSLEDAMKEDVGSYWGLLFLPFMVVLFIIFKRVSAGRQPI